MTKPTIDGTGAWRIAVGAKTVVLVPTGVAMDHFRAEVDGERRRMRVDGQLVDMAKLEPLVGCLESEHAGLTAKDGHAVFELREYGLSGFNSTTTVTVAIDAAGVVEIETEYRENEIDPNVGW